MLSKRTAFLLFSVLVVLTLLAAQCGATPTPETIVEKVVETVIVEKEVEGETVTVVETVEVEKEVVVTMEVEKEVVVTATPEPMEEPRIIRVGQNAADLQSYRGRDGVLEHSVTESAAFAGYVTGSRPGFRGRYVSMDASRSGRCGHVFHCESARNIANRSGYVPDAGESSGTMASGYRPDGASGNLAAHYRRSRLGRAEIRSARFGVCRISQTVPGSETDYLRYTRL